MTRMMPTRYIGKAQPYVVKKERAHIAHVTPPFKGISLATTYTPGDPQTATILSNFVIEDDRIQVRAGFKKIASRGTTTVWNLIPWYGSSPRLAAASNNELWDATTGTLLRGGFTSNDWDWTSFADLSQNKYTVIVNGTDGVWSWDGGSTATGPVVNVTRLSKSVPPAFCIVTVAPADIGSFVNGTKVTISGATTPGIANANGTWVIRNVNSPANTFELIGADTSTASADQTTGTMQARNAGSFVKELVVATDTWINPNQFNIVLSHMNRLWFADKSNLAVYYLPLQQKYGTLKVLPLNSLFRRGGSIRAMATWTVEGGTGLNDQLVIFSTNGECVIYQGTDPDDAAGGNWQLTGIFRFDSPMSKHSIVNYGGDLYVLISTGVVPMSTLLKAESEQLGQSDRNVVSLFRKQAIGFRDSAGWQLMLNPSTSRLFANIPQGGTQLYIQMIRHMTSGAWSRFDNIPARCWNWVDPYVYFGDDKGNIYQMHPVYRTDDDATGARQPIKADVQMAWGNFKTPAKKHFTAVQTYLFTDGSPNLVVDMKVNYDSSKGVNEPDITVVTGGAYWELAVWDQDYWEPQESMHTIWNGVAPLGHVGAIRLTALVHDCTFSVTGWDVVYEAGVFGP